MNSRFQGIVVLNLNEFRLWILLVVFRKNCVLGFLGPYTAMNIANALGVLYMKLFEAEVRICLPLFRRHFKVGSPCFLRR